MDYRLVLVFLGLVAMAGVAYLHGRRSSARGVPRSLLLVWSIGSVLQLAGFTVMVLPRLSGPPDAVFAAFIGVAISVSVLGASALGYLIHSPARVDPRDRADLPAEGGESMDRFGHSLAKSLVVGTGAYVIYCAVTRATFFDDLSFVAELSIAISIIYIGGYLRDRIRRGKTHPPGSSAA